MIKRLWYWYKAINVHERVKNSHWIKHINMLDQENILILEDWLLNRRKNTDFVNRKKQALNLHYSAIASDLDEKIPQI